jgi:rhamnogalacturonyl hydrolase YesR
MQSRPFRSTVQFAVAMLLGATVVRAEGSVADDLRATLPRMADAELAALKGDPPPIDWEAGTLYAGMSADDRATGDGHNAGALKRIADRHGWKPNQGSPRAPFFADHICVCQTYLDLYDRSHDPAALGPTREAMDALLQHLSAYQPGAKPTWWWCDALFMGPAVLAHLSADTGDRKYLDAMDAEWWRTTALLYDPHARLFFRDGTFLPGYHLATRSSTKPAATTKPWRAVYWSRGNGWVVAGLARVLTYMPADYPTRPRYVSLYRDMVNRLVELQPADGLWRADLLADPATATGETSGTALNVYAIAWGINHGLLDRGRFLPIVAKGYAGLRRCVLPDGRVGYGQPHGYKPAPAPADSVTSFGVGAYLLAGSELLPLAKDLPAPVR